MPGKTKFTEINYYHHQEFQTPGEAISKHRPTNLYLRELRDELSITLVKHAAFEGSETQDALEYRFFRGKNAFRHIPFRAHRYISSSTPDVVLVQGLIFPIQVMALRMKLGRRCLILLQHQGEVPYMRKRFLQKWADRSVSGYLFTSKGNAEEWISAGVIRNAAKCFEIPDASVDFIQREKSASRAKTGMGEGPNFLWVGRLNENKDPMTVLSAFESHIAGNRNARLYMIYQSGELLDQIRERLKDSHSLQKAVILVGKVDHDLLPDWYSAADYFISASHREGGSYALTEAMSCGCVPIVSAIPASLKAMGNTGYQFEKGDAAGLTAILNGLEPDGLEHLSANVKKHYAAELSASAKAGKMLSVIRQLQSK